MSNPPPTMVIPRRPHSSSGYTVIESLVVLVILAILSMVALALFLHETDPASSEDKKPAAAYSNAGKDQPGDTTDTADRKGEKE